MYHNLFSAFRLILSAKGLRVDALKSFMSSMTTVVKSYAYSNAAVSVYLQRCCVVYWVGGCRQSKRLRRSNRSSASLTKFVAMVVLATTLCCYAVYTSLWEAMCSDGIASTVQHDGVCWHFAYASRPRNVVVILDYASRLLLGPLIFTCLCQCWTIAVNSRNWTLFVACISSRRSGSLELAFECSGIASGEKLSVVSLQEVCIFASGV